MAGELTKTEKKTTNRTVERDYTLYLYPKAKVVLARVVTKDTDVKKGEPVITWYLFSLEIYGKYQHRKYWTWIISLDQDDLFAVITVEYMNHYLNGSSHMHPDDKPKNIAESGWKKVLDAGGYDRVVRDQTWYDGMMYDSQGNHIRRAFNLDYISSNLGSSNYEISKLEEWLKRQKSVKNVERIDVPCYNQDSFGPEAIEFTFQPSRGVFSRMCKKESFTSFQMGDFIIEHLKVDKFEIPKRV